MLEKHRDIETHLCFENPLLSKEGWLRPVRKCREATIAGADGVVRRAPAGIRPTTPAASFKGCLRRYFLNDAATPPSKGGDFQ
jgi:hypothetical protein